MSGAKSLGSDTGLKNVRRKAIVGVSDIEKMLEEMWAFLFFENFLKNFGKFAGNFRKVVHSIR